MQLLVLLLMLLSSGKNSDLKQIEPLLTGFGGGEAANVLKQAEELSGMLSAVQSLTGGGNGAPFGGSGASDDGGFNSSAGEDINDGYPLAPIANIADEKITYALSKYIATGE
ncbi:MAG: hypothetical protein K2N47_02200 [Clostridia bacterium]|nr:hypothetical protein [Clostridia bacterium]